MTPDVFAANRGKRLTEVDTELLTVVKKALEHWSAKGDWYESIVDGASVLWLEMFEESVPDAEPKERDELLAAFQKDLRATLSKTSNPKEAAATQAQTITEWVSTSTANHAELRAARVNGHPALRWVTRKDSRVRSSHRAIDGTTVPAGQTFKVGDVHLAYPGEPIGSPANWINCRCILQRVGEGKSMAGNATAFTEGEALVAAAEQTPPDAEGQTPDEMTTEDVHEDDLIDAAAGTEVPFHGVAAPVDTASGDNRQLSAGGFSIRPLPLPLAYQRGSSHGGDSGPAVTVGRIDRIFLDDATNLVMYEGVFSPNITEAAEAIQHVIDGTMRGVSVDVDAAVMAQVDYEDDSVMQAMEEGTLVTVFDQWRIAGITMVSIPAFHEAYIALGPLDSETYPEAMEAEPGATAASAFAPGTHDGPGWITDPVPTARIRRYWVRGPGAAKIGWNVPGDFNRCRSQLAKYVPNPDWLAGLCANMHKEATGAWPGHGAGEQHALRASALRVRTSSLLASASPALVSAGEQGVGFAEIVAVPANRARGKSASEIFFTGDRLQVSSPDARSHAAKVVEVQTFGDRAVLSLESEDVGAGALPLAVSVGVHRPDPYETFATRMDEVVELRLVAGYRRPSGADAPVMAFAHSAPEAVALAAITQVPLTAFDATHEIKSIPTAAAINLVASAAPAVPDGEWFLDPQLDGPTPFTVEDTGRVYGHVATWSTCHIGFDQVCTTAPSSTSNYAYYRTGEIDTTLGPVAVGQVTMGAGHADLRAGAQAAAAHYDNVAHAVADVSAGEDAHGIWVAGALRPGLDEDDVRALRAASLSGDWRRIRGGMEMVAALAVNVPGFPIPRNSIAASGAQQLALVAAGVVQEEAAPDVVEGDFDGRVQVAVERALARREKAASAKSRAAAAVRTARLARARRIGR